MRRFLALVCALVATLTASAWDFSETAPTGQTLYFERTSATTAKVVAPDGYSWDGYTTPAGALTIPQQAGGCAVTAIDRLAFVDCQKLVSVQVPGSVLTVGMRAFALDTLLESVVMAEGVQQIESMAFSGCSRLAYVDLPSTLVRLGNAAFNSTAFYMDSSNWTACYTLALDGWVLREGDKWEGPVAVGEGVVGIANNAFFGCAAVDVVELPSTLRIIGDEAFRQCPALDTLRLAAVEPPKLGSDVFVGTPVSVVEVPCHSLALYQAAAGWSAMNIVEVGCVGDTVADTVSPLPPVPPLPPLPPVVGIDEAGAEGLTIRATSCGVAVCGLEEGMATVYDLRGRRVAAVAGGRGEVEVALPAAGIYLLATPSGRACKLAYFK
ncbi:MAG: leucine-rich repeat domain-containing protein [Bacteroidales bacterium]|nr:leucine-rich repeat domain-containing protein [Bacteroidales bacterium]